MCSRGHLARWGQAADRAAATPRWRPGADGQVWPVCWKDAEPLVSGVVRSDLIVCGPSVAPMWPQPVWSEVLGQGAASLKSLGATEHQQVPGVPSCAPPLQDRSPALLCHQPRAGATLVRGTFLANRRPAVETRVHQSGGPPTHAAPAHRADPRARRLPPATGPWIGHHQHHQGRAYRTAFRLTAAPISASPRSCLQNCLQVDRRSHISPYVLRGRPFLDENRGWLPADAGSP
jgi:hypothetical protein